MTLGIDWMTYSCNQCPGRSTDEVSEIVSSIAKTLDIAQGRTSSKVTPEKSMELLDDVLKRADGFLGRYHGQRFQLNYARAAVAQAVGDKVGQLRHWDKCLEAAWRLLRPSMTDPILITLSLQMFMASTRLEDRVRLSKQAIELHNLAFGGGRALFDARNGPRSSPP